MVDITLNNMHNNDDLLFQDTRTKRVINRVFLDRFLIF